MLPESIQVLLLVTSAFENLQIRYLVGGSMASALYGVSRSTLDADVVADISEADVERLIAALGADFYADSDMIRGAI